MQLQGFKFHVSCLRKGFKAPGFRHMKEKGHNDCTINCAVTTMPYYFKIMNINRSVQTNAIAFLSWTENTCSSPDSRLSYTGTAMLSLNTQVYDAH